MNPRPVTAAPASPSRPPTSTGSNDWATTPPRTSLARGGGVGVGCTGATVGAAVAVGVGATTARCERAFGSFEMSMTSGSGLGSAVGSAVGGAGAGSTGRAGAGARGGGGAASDALAGAVR